jgi:hypothetical protein
MKIELGPYKNWFGPYQLAEKILFWKDKDDDIIMTLGDFIAHGKWVPYTTVSDIFKKDEQPETWLYKLMQWWQKTDTRKEVIHIDPYDTWSMDNTLAKIVHPMLVQLKATKHGYPTGIDLEDVPENLRAVDTTEEYFFGGQMQLFEYEVCNPEHITIEEARWDWVLDEMIYAFSILNDDDKAWIADDNKRVDNGCRLFGKYYRALWD